jgi:hypothetical protein
VENHTFTEVMDGVVLEYPDGPLFKSYASLPVRKVVDLDICIKNFKAGHFYDLFHFFTKVLPINKKTKKKVAKMGFQEVEYLIQEWLKENDIPADWFDEHTIMKDL